MKRLVVCLFVGTILTMFMATASLAAENDATAVPEKSVTVKKKSKKAAKVDLVDINTASAEQLKSLAGITDEDAQKIIAGRPYSRKNQLTQKNIISAEIYKGIKDKIVAKKVKNKS